MKTLLIVRHAKSSHAEPPLADHDRPLEQRGMADAPRMGRFLAARGLRPDLIVSSTALRARRTAETIALAARFECTIDLREGVYDAGGGPGLLKVARGFPDGAGCVMLVGHNPALESLLESLTGAREELPTCAVAEVRLEVERWTDLDAGCGRLVHLWHPRGLAAEA
jgi:phosphohistidine phosphatase